MYNKNTVLKSQFRYPLSRFSPHAPQDNFAYVRVQLPQVLVCCTAVQCRHAPSTPGGGALRNTTNGCVVDYPGARGFINSLGTVYSGILRFWETTHLPLP